MTDLLLIRLKATTNIDWAIFSDNQLISSQYDTDFSTIEAAALDYQIVVLVPSADVTLHSAILPATSKHKLLQAAPYAIEQQVAEPIEQLHIAIGNRQNDGQIPVAAVSHTQMSVWLEQLASAKIQPNIMLPDGLLLPLQPHSWSLYVENDQAIVRTNEFRCYTIDGVNLLPVLQSELTNSTINSIQLAAPNTVAENLIPSLAVTIDHVTDTYFDFIANNITLPDFNLLQQQYRAKATKKNISWRWPIILLAVWILIFILGSATMLGVFKYRQHQLHKTIISLYTQVFPSAANMEDPKADLKAELRRYQGESNDVFLANLGKLEHVLVNNPQIKLQQLIWQNKKLQITLTAPDTATVDKLITKLTLHGINGKTTDLKLKKDLAVAKLTITGAN